MNDKNETTPLEQGNSDLKELAIAMNNLAEAINNTNDSIKTAMQDDPNWRKIPSIFLDLNKRLLMLSTRL